MQCDGTASLDAFIEHFRKDSKPTYVSLLCCGCSTADIAIAEISHYWNIPQVLSEGNVQSIMHLSMSIPPQIRVGTWGFNWVGI